MHRLCFFLTFLLVYCLGYAKPVSEQEAIQIAKNFFSENSTRRAKALSFKTSNFTVAYTCQNETSLLTRSSSPQEAYYYVINVNEDDGYIIVSGDDRARNILAYSHKGKFNPENIPANSAEWLQGYKEQISRLMSEPEETTGNSLTNKAISYPSITIEPMVQTTWGQGNPYNLQCPVDQTAEGNNELSAVGCTATATAQIVNYHQWPERASGSITYFDTNQNVTRNMNFDERPAFDWGNMKLDYTLYDGSLEEEKNAVANLMVCVGHASKMAYSAAASGASLKNAALGLKQYFNYDRNIRIYESAYTPTDEWIEILIGELTANRPILYSGYNNKVGHAFVCDGYDGNGMFHFNWGWGGSSDGYYAISALYPGVQGIGGSNGSYTFSQTIVTNIQPPTSDSEPQINDLAIVSLYAIYGTYYENEPIEAPIGENFGIGFYFQNTGLNDSKGELNVGIIRNDQIIPLSTTIPFELAVESGAQYKSFTIDIKDLPEGEYTVYCLHRADTNSEWSIIQADQKRANSFLMTITDTKVRLEKINPKLSITLAEGFNPGKLYVNSSKVWYLDISNDGDVRLEGQVGIRLSGETLNEPVLYTVLAYCVPGETARIRVQADINVATGNYTITPVYFSDNSIYSTPSIANAIPLCEDIPVAVSIKPMVYIVEKAEGYILDKKNNEIEAKITQPSGLVPWEGRICAKIFIPIENEFTDKIDTGISLYSEYLIMNKGGETKTITLKAESVDLPEGNNYIVLFYIDDGNENVMSSASLSIIDSGTSISNKTLSDVRLAYNPQSSVIYVTAEMPIHQLSVINLDGNMLYTSTINGSNEYEIPVGYLSTGIYFIQIQTDNSTITKKIIIP